MTQIKELLSRARENLFTISENAPLIDAAKLLSASGDMVVVGDAAGRLAGVVTKSDVVSRISVCQGASCLAAASEAMTRTVVTCTPDDWLHQVWPTMQQRGLKNIPVVDTASRPLGVLNVRDVLQVLLQDVEYEESLLRDYVMGVGYR